MDRKASAFVAAFGATLFTQWAAQPHMDEHPFWTDASALQRMLEDGIAKLPQPKLQAALSRDLAGFLTQLQTLLADKHRDYEKQQPKKNKKKSETTAVPSLTLLNEEDVERALAIETFDDSTASVLAQEDVLHAVRLQDAAKTAASAAALVAIVGECTERLRVVRARRFESASERDGIAAFYWTLIHTCSAKAMQHWCDNARGVWCVAASKASERETLRRVLQSLVVADAALASTSQDAWSAFYRPPLSKLFRSGDLFSAHARVYGVLLSLAVAFPVVYEDGEKDEDATSGSSSSDDSDSDSDIDSPTNRHAADAKKLQQKNKRDHQDCSALATHVVRQIVLTAKREEKETDWYLAVLQAFHALATPTQYISGEDDEDEEALTTDQHAMLLDARAELYARAFASSSSLWTTHPHDPLLLLETLLCLRHASEFLRVDRKQTVPAVSTATAQLVGVPLPTAFWHWLAYVKKVFAGQDAIVQTLMKKLTKHKATGGDKKTANVLMHDSVVTLSELRVVVEQFALYLETEEERSHFVVARGPAMVGSGGGEDAGDDAPDQVLFFQDNDGGRSKKRTTTEDESKASVRTKRGRTDV